MGFPKTNIFMISFDENNQVFQLATDFVNQTSKHVFLTGKAGTGKTTFLKHIEKQTHKNCIIAAPTGVAAINAGGVTLHSLFQLPFEPFIPGMEYRSAKDRFKMSASKLEMLRQLELLIIDEVSMLRSDLLDSIDSILKRIRRSDAPFGGIQMLYIGDLFQLPPVVKEDEWNLLKPYYRSPFFFHSKVVERNPPVYLELKKIYRQREQFFVDMLNRVRNDQLTDRDLQVLNQQYQPHFKVPEGEKYITLTTRNAKADHINGQELDRLKSKAYQFTGRIKGEFPDYALPTEMILTLKEGAQIMFIKNDVGEQRRYYNGKLGTISHIDDEDIEVKLADSEEVILLEKEVWSNIRYTLNKETKEIEEEELGSFEQYPIRLAWAITIHKSQGLTFERAVIDTGDAFAPGQAYVALSRCTSLESIVLLSPISYRSVQTDIHAVNLSKTEKRETELQHILEAEKQQFWADRLLKYFDFDKLVVIIRNFRSQLEDKTSKEYEQAHALSENMMQQSFALRSVAEKFQQQLKRLIQQSASTEILSERCKKAVCYFHETIVDQILLPFQEYILHFKISKAKTFYKHICSYEQDLKSFLDDLKKVRYHNILLVDDLQLVIPNRKSLYQDEKKAKAPKTSEKKQKKEIQEEEEPDKQESLELFGNGFSVAEIAHYRGLSQNTILTHLTEYVLTGELAASSLLPPNKIDYLTPWVQAAIAEDDLHIGPIKEQVGDDYSYSDIRIVMNHCLYQNGQK